MIRGGIGSIAVQLFSKAASFAVTVLLARLLGAAGFGIYSYALAVLTVLGIPTHLGVPQLVVKEVAIAKSREEWGRLRGILRFAFCVIGVLSTVVILGSLAIVPNISYTANHFAVDAFYIALILLPVIALEKVRGGALRGLGRVVIGQLPENVIRPSLFLFLLVVVSAAAGESPLSAELALILQAVAATAAFAVGSILLFRNLPDSLRLQEPIYETRAWMGTMLPFSALGGFQIINKNVDLLIIGALLSPEDVGVYRVAAMVGMFMGFILQAFNSVIAPQFAALHSGGDLEGLAQVARQGSILVTIATVPVVVTGILFGQPLLRLVFGPEFLGGYVALVIFAVGHGLAALIGCAGMLLNMTGEERPHARVMGGMIFLNIPLNILLIPLFGISGAALATVGSLLIARILLWYAVRKQLGINTFALAKSWIA